MKTKWIVVIFVALIWAVLTPGIGTHAQIPTVAGVNSCIQQGSSTAQGTTWTNVCSYGVAFQLWAFNSNVNGMVIGANLILAPGASTVSDPILSNPFKYFVCPSGYTAGISGSVGIAVNASTDSYQCFPS